jgi:NTE family protein
LTLFSTPTLSHEALLASSCLPQLFPATRIEGVDYWDGVFSGNPVLEPLIANGMPRDLLVVLVQGLANAGDSIVRRHIGQHSQSLGFASAFRRELRDLLRLRDVLRSMWWVPRRLRPFRDVRIHVLQPHSDLSRDAGLSRLDVQRADLVRLRDCGREVADKWLVEHAAHLGHRDSFDHAGWLLSERALPADAQAIARFPA